MSTQQIAVGLRQRRLWVAVVLCFLVAIIAGCGGGGGGTGGNSTPAPTALSYASPQSSTVGVAITTLAPTVTGTVTSYSVAPALPRPSRARP